MDPYGILSVSWRINSNPLLVCTLGFISTLLLAREIPSENALISVAVRAVGGLGSEGDKTVLLGPKNWNPISSSKWTLLARHG